MPNVVIAEINYNGPDSPWTHSDAKVSLPVKRNNTEVREI